MYPGFFAAKVEVPKQLQTEGGLGVGTHWSEHNFEVQIGISLPKIELPYFISNSRDTRNIYWDKREVETG